MEDGGRLGKGPALLTLPGPMEPVETPEPGAEEAGCAEGLLAGREGGVDIWFCYRGQDIEVRARRQDRSFSRTEIIFIVNEKKSSKNKEQKHGSV